MSIQEQLKNDEMITTISKLLYIKYKASGIKYYEEYEDFRQNYFQFLLKYPVDILEKKLLYTNMNAFIKCEYTKINAEKNKLNLPNNVSYLDCGDNLECYLNDKNLIMNDNYFSIYDDFDFLSNNEKKLCYLKYECKYRLEEIGKIVNLNTRQVGYQLSKIKNKIKENYKF